MNQLIRPFNVTKQHYVIANFEEFQDGRLTEAELEFYHQHLSDCRECQQWFEEQASVIAWLRDEMPPILTLSPAETERFHHNLYSILRRSTIMNSVKTTISTVAAVAVLAVILGVFFLWQQAGSETSGQPPTSQQESANQVSSQAVENPATAVQEEASQDNQQSEQPDLEIVEASQATEEQSELESPPQDELNELLLDAVRTDNLAEIDRLLEAGADPNTESSSGYSMLGLAASKGNADMAALLISHGASVDGRATNAPLVLAVRFGRLEMVKQLLDAGADVEGTVALEGSYTNSTAMQWAAAENYADIAELLIAHGADVNTIETQYNRTPLHAAAYYNCPEVLQILLANGADPEMRDAFGDTPLHYAVSNGVVETARILIEHGVALDTRDDLGRTLMDEAGVNSEMVQLLRDAGVEE